MVIGIIKKMVSLDFMVQLLLLLFLLGLGVLVFYMERKDIDGDASIEHATAIPIFTVIVGLLIYALITGL